MRSRSARIYHQVMAGHHPNTPAPTGPLLQKVNYRKVMEYWTPLLSWHTGGNNQIISRTTFVIVNLSNAITLWHQPPLKYEL